MKKRGLQAPHNHLYNAKVINIALLHKYFSFFYYCVHKYFYALFLLSSRVNNLVEGIHFLLNAFACK